MLRGCTLKNTDWVIGVVIYTGHDTKIFKNSKTPPIKVSNVMKLMNKLLYSVFAFQLILCFLFSIGFIIWQNSRLESLSYLQKYNGLFEEIKPTAKMNDLILKFFTFLVAYSHMIPISLYVAMELVKLGQGFLINYDNDIVDPITKVPTISRTSDLIEELGQVRFIFSDKTGTLTKNEMEFKKCFINNQIYGNQENDNISSRNSEQEIGNYNINGDKRAYKILKNRRKESSKDRVFISDFFTLMSVCHSAYLDIKEDKNLFQVKYFKILIRLIVF